MEHTGDIRQEERRLWMRLPQGLIQGLIIDIFDSQWSFDTLHLRLDMQMDLDMLLQHFGFGNMIQVSISTWWLEVVRQRDREIIRNPTSSCGDDWALTAQLICVPSFLIYFLEVQTVPAF